MNKGILNGIAAYALWGFFPIYWKLLQQVPALQVIGHRIGWSFILLIAFILFTKQSEGISFRSPDFQEHRYLFYRRCLCLPSIGWYMCGGSMQALLLRPVLAILSIRFSVYCWGSFFCASVCASPNGFRLPWPRQACSISPLPMDAHPGSLSRLLLPLAFMGS